MNENAQKFAYKIHIIKNNNDTIWVHIAQGVAIPPFSKILLLVLSRILLQEIVQRFACNKFILRDTIDIMFEGIA